MNDSWVFPLVIIPLLIILFTITRFITTLFHELGHAIPAMIFTKKPVTVFLGSYGDVQKSKCVRLLNRFSIYFTLNPLKWRWGMVTHSGGDLSTYKKITISASGPLFTLIITSFAVWVVYSYNLNGFLKLFSILLLMSALFDLRNIYPSERPFLLHDGTYTYCDGRQILTAFKFRKDRDELLLAYKFYSDNNYQEAINSFEKLQHKFITKSILKLAIYSYIQIKQYKEGKSFYHKYIDTPVFNNLDSEDFFNIGLIESSLNENDLGLQYYNKSIELNNENVYSLSNRGYTYNLLSNYTLAIYDFDKVIRIDPNSAYAFANRAYSKIKLQLLAQSLEDINKALNIECENSYARRNFGVYYIEIGDYEMAKKQLQMAYKLDPNTHMIEDYMKIVEDKLSNVRV